MGLPGFDAAQLTLLQTPFNDPEFIFELKLAWLERQQHARN